MTEVNMQLIVMKRTSVKKQRNVHALSYVKGMDKLARVKPIMERKVHWTTGYGGRGGGPAVAFPTEVDLFPY